jgi:DNA repair protein RadA/Sms
MYICQSCSLETPQWLGQCPSCNGWNSFEETVIAATFTKSGIKSAGAIKAISLSNVKNKEIKRVSSGSEEFDRVLGGGFVPGQVILLAGDPGIGKSTLLTQIAKNMGDKKVLFVCGEESLGQIRVRADRMKYKAENLLAIPETNADIVAATMSSEQDISLVIVDSIQAITSNDYMGFAGSVGQVRGGTQKLTNVAKRLGVPLILVGHVTKAGNVAGPKVLEHIVDTVLYLEGDSQHLFRILKTTKNRFGPVSEVGIFEMTENAMDDVTNPSEMFLSEKADSSGSCVSVVMEGFRPILFEIQALTTKTPFGYPRRTTSGFPANRLQVLIAILQKRCGLNLSDQDVYVNVAGGFKVNEYAVDLAVCMAIASSLKDKPLKPKTLAFGEMGLSGEIRNVSHQDKRIKEAKKLGYTNIISPQQTKSVKEALREALQ